MPLPRLLVVDDNAVWCGTIARILENNHELVGAVGRGDEIMESAERLCPDVITLDVSLLGESGLNVLPRVRKACPRAIIIIVSATATPIYREEAALRGADGYVEKSRVDSELMSTIASVQNMGLFGSAHSPQPARNNQASSITCRTNLPDTHTG